MTDSQGHFESTIRYVSLTEGKILSYTFPHIHNHYEIYYNISGAKGFMVNGVFYKCRERDLIIIPRLEAHKVVLDSEEQTYSRCVINIDDRLLSVLEMISPDKESLDWLVGNSTSPRKTTLSLEQHIAFMKNFADYQSCHTREEKLGVIAKILSYLQECFKSAVYAEFL